PGRSSRPNVLSRRVVCITSVPSWSVETPRRRPASTAPYREAPWSIGRLASLNGRHRTFCRYAGAMTSALKGQRPSEARDRLLRTASAIFYAKGINSVGVEEIVSEARVTRATFYRHFPSKEDLIVAYLKATDDDVRAQVHAITEHQQ